VRLGATLVRGARTEGAEEGELRGGVPAPRHGARAKGMMPHEDTEVANGVGTGRWNQGAESSEEGVGGHVREGGPAVAGLFECTRTWPSGGRWTAS